MICPGCPATMTLLTLGGHQGASVEIDMCGSCRAFWFDRYESLQLSAASILKLFSLMADHGTASPPRQGMACPRCGSGLVLTHDVQNTTRFQYWRCDWEHGRFISYIDFLREKDFIKPLSPQQLAALQEHVGTVNCGNCGGPIDLAHGSICPHCGSPLSLLDVPHMEATLARLQDGEAFNHKDTPQSSVAKPPLMPFDVATLAHNGITVDEDLKRFVKWLQTGNSPTTD
jgi:hypothetical protein